MEKAEREEEAILARQLQSSERRTKWRQSKFRRTGQIVGYAMQYS